ncbi:MAG: ABC transporter permease [Verrucomicrobia bacterium]|nr:ABC transporter permease [Verrucomicrobiota bacterium]
MKSLYSHWHRSVVRTLTLAWLESLAIRRDPVILAMILVVPTLQVVLFGYALRPLGGAVLVVVARTDKDPALLNLLEKWGDFRVVADGLSKEEALTRLRRQEALVAIVVHPPDASAGAGTVTVYADDSDPARSNPALSKLEAFYWRQIADPDVASSMEVRVERLYNPQSRNEWILTPALSGVVVMISTLMLGALSIVRERERGTWEAMLSTPVNGLEAVVGKALPYQVLGCAQAVLVIGCCRALFGLPLRGDLPAFGLFLAVFIFAHLVMGLTVSAAAGSQLQAVQGAVLIYLPSMLLSGFLFPFVNMPGWAQRLGALFPLTYYTEVARGVMLRGEDAAFVHARTLPVAAIAATALLAALLVFRRRLP